MNKVNYSGWKSRVLSIIILTGVILLTILLPGCDFLECEECEECGKTECIDFEDPALSTEYNYLDVIDDSGSMLLVDLFQWGNGTWYDGGNATIQNSGEAGGTGQEVWLNNVNIQVDLCEPVEGISLRYGAYGGNQNLIVNGCLENFNDFATLPATMCGVSVSVTPTSGSTGILTLCGTITNFSIGGQEFVVDDICFDVCE
jgi:hypothetical protein